MNFPNVAVKFYIHVAWLEVQNQQNNLFKKLVLQNLLSFCEREINPVNNKKINRVFVNYRMDPKFTSTIHVFEIAHRTLFYLI